MKRVFLTVLIIAAAAWAGNRYLFDSDPVEPFVSPFTQQQTDRVQPLQPQPPGPAPDGKVWSAEHGHWHDAGTTDPAEDYKPGPQPPGLVPSGKIWSYEHGHWHDSSSSGQDNFNPGPPPAGPAPEGKAWSFEHGHWHDALTPSPNISTSVNPGTGTGNFKPGSPPPGTGTGNFKPGSPPPGPAPEGKAWSAEHGHWHNAPTSNLPDSKKITPKIEAEKVKISTSDKKGD
ncbi:MAG: hypothetical protein V3W18_05735 [candidate division Zixibacteria bacterium]